MPGFTDYKNWKACLLVNRWIRLYAVPFASVPDEGVIPSVEI